MRGGQWIPGIELRRRGLKLRGSFLLALFIILVTIAFWRHEMIWQSLTAAAGCIRGASLPAGELSFDRLVASLVVLGGIAAALLWTWLPARRGRATEVPRPTEGRSSLFAARIARNRLAVTGIGMLLLLYLAAILCPILTPYDPTSHGDTIDELLQPSIEHPLGTDEYSRDVLSRILYGSRISLLVGFLAVGIAVGIGTVYGAVAGYCGGRVDSVMMRFLDMILAFPSLILVITVIHLWRSHSIWVIITVIGLISWMGVARLVRGQFLVLKEQEFYQAAVALGAGPVRLVMLHLLPNATTPVIISATLRVGNTILLEAGLSYLGLGVQPPTPSWGNIIYDNRELIFSHWWIAFSAGLAIVLTVVAYNLLGDGLRDALDPRAEK